jgi:NAD(P)-dependent dehydrogenase (short-subunit alcohol dehydrogenase family)
LTDNSHPKPPSPRTVLITGASRGIGRAAAQAFARQGDHLILVARTRGGLEEADDEVRNAGGTATLVPLDLKDAEKVDALGPSLFPRFPHVDVLVANAGILGPITPVGHIQDKDWAEVVAVNLTANWRLIRTLEPLLKRSAAGRAIFVTSGAASNPRAYWGPYAATKAGLEALVKTWAAELANSPVRINLLSPGRVRTAMRAKAYPGEDPKTVPAPADIAQRFLDLAALDLTETGQVFGVTRA